MMESLIGEVLLQSFGRSNCIPHEGLGSHERVVGRKDDCWLHPQTVERRIDFLEPGFEDFASLVHSSIDVRSRVRFSRL